MALIPAVATYCYHPGEVHAINGRDCHLGGPHLQRIFGDDGGIHNSHGPDPHCLLGNVASYGGGPGLLRCEGLSFTPLPVWR